ncbi:hypothetical protein Q8A67_018211 [Cirrhinus molitorella]|uniref:Uncharacterized protein n=1 Tax=Cirrhinus molitorella TaxID=172907 RepID=A0AA88PDZ6_9TELE|nr:hypothetical protein Q8A67_018211 [Cirrhinus molitorella]
MVYLCPTRHLRQLKSCIHQRMLQLLSPGVRLRIRDARASDRVHPLTRRQDEITPVQYQWDDLLLRQRICLAPSPAADIGTEARDIFVACLPAWCSWGNRERRL